jgi:hypothetical protein
LMIGFTASNICCDKGSETDPMKCARCAAFGKRERLPYKF